MTSPVSAIEAIEKAMEGVTAEEWIVNGDRFSVETDATFIPDQKVIALCATGDGAMARALYIAACNPVAMREVLALARQAEALQRENAELREALKPFSKIPSHGTFGGPLCGMKAVYEDGSDSKIPPYHSVLGHEPVRRARALMKGEDDAGN